MALNLIEYNGLLLTTEEIKLKKYFESKQIENKKAEELIRSQQIQKAQQMQDIGNRLINVVQHRKVITNKDLAVVESSDKQEESVWQNTSYSPSATIKRNKNFEDDSDNDDKLDINKSLKPDVDVDGLHSNKFSINTQKKKEINSMTNIFIIT